MSTRIQWKKFLRGTAAVSVLASLFIFSRCSAGESVSCRMMA